MHLLGRVEFRSSGRTLKSWMKTFPDPSKSLAYCMRGLYLSHIEAISVGSLLQPYRGSASGGHWGGDHHIFVTRLHGLPPLLRSFAVTMTGKLTIHLEFG